MPLLLTKMPSMLQNLLEKLQYNQEKNILIQGLPSSVEKQFMKLTFAKNVTPLLKARRIDFALVFAVNENQLKGILCEVLPALKENGIFWIAYPKLSSKIATDLSRACSWDCVHDAGYYTTNETALDHVWTAVRYQKVEIKPKAVRKAVKRPSLETLDI